jgi:hypothetical protein
VKPPNLIPKYPTWNSRLYFFFLIWPNSSDVSEDSYLIKAVTFWVQVRVRSK